MLMPRATARQSVSGHGRADLRSRLATRSGPG